MARQLLPDELWQLIEPLLPTRPARPKGGRPLLQDRDVLTGIVFMLKTGIAWEDLPREMGCGCGMTCLRRLREWQEQGIWPSIERLLQAHLPDAQRIDWSRAEARSTANQTPALPGMDTQAASELLPQDTQMISTEPAGQANHISRLTGSAH